MKHDQNQSTAEGDAPATSQRPNGSARVTEPHALRGQLGSLDSAGPDYAIQFVATLLQASRQMEVSDVHLQPTPDGLDLQWRVDGVLQPLGTFPSGQSADVVTRLKVLAGLLTYRHDVPQEGRIDEAAPEVEMRVSTFPTLHGERAVVRLFSVDQQHLHLQDLGLPDSLRERLEQLLGETSGALLATGPAGSGKTTTVYACLRHLVKHSGGGRCLVSLEDPIEVAVPGVAQSQVNPSAGFDMARGLRSLLRQDPEVIMVGEIRDRETAEVAFQASLTGQLVLTTFHAGSAAEAIGRLSDMGMEPYVLRSGVLGIVSQRLVRRLCPCAQPIREEHEKLGLPVQGALSPVGCLRCNRTGYRGRQVIAELLASDRGNLGRAILSREDAATLERLAVQAGMITRWQRAIEAVEAGRTSPAEIRRVLGFSGPMDTE
jgi:type II secretory ATPase GspE/PulE/Tfp pilus assembly ATPase PilB-like protein